jgi:hypothetical protein
MCKEKDCKKQPSYNIEGEKALYCLTHKTDKMVDVKNKKCIHPDCKKIPNFNIEGKKALYCSEHKTCQMVDVNHTKCIYINCKKIPNFNIEGGKPLYCSMHKLDNMINIVNKKCIYPDCKKRPNYNLEGKKALYCSAHSTDKMVNVVSKTCIHTDCKKQPSYNIEGKKPIYCVVHKKKEMINVKCKTCIHKDCTKIPTFNIDGEKALYCAKHKNDNMVDVANTLCKTYLCFTQVQEKYDGYCLFCYINTFPDKPVSRNYKTKEYAVVERIKTKYPDVTWKTDKIVQDGCSKRRPDILLDLGYQIIIVEVDENQHIDYDCSCENKRIMELSQDLGHRPIVFIRFNPDDYNNGKNISSCWGQDKKGICVVKKSKKEEWNERLNTLEETIKYWIHPENKTNKTIETIQLFYDVCVSY